MKIDKKFFRMTGKIKTPFIVYDLSTVARNYRKIARAFPGVQVNYAMKCNPLPQIIDTLIKERAGFEVASLAEVEQLIEQGVSATRIVCMHPIKSPEFLLYMQRAGISIMAVDSYEEVDKIAKYAPGSKLAARVIVDNEGSVWPLTGKFGIEVTEFPRFLKYIRSRDLVPYGLTFHVGSQCENEANWIKALDICSDVWKTARNERIELAFLSLGGGLAVPYRRPVPDIKKVGKSVITKLRQNFFNKRGVYVTIDVGRSIAATAGVLVTSVFGIARRGSKNWAYIETGTYNGLVEAIETEDRNLFPIVVRNAHRKRMVYNIGGPSCVSLDTPFEEVELPEVKVGDRLYIINCGAYNSTCSAPFNGFTIPKVLFYDGVSKKITEQQIDV